MHHWSTFLYPPVIFYLNCHSFLKLQILLSIKTVSWQTIHLTEKLKCSYVISNIVMAIRPETTKSIHTITSTIHTVQSKDFTCTNRYNTMKKRSTRQYCHTLQDLNILNYDPNIMTSDILIEANSYFALQKEDGSISDTEPKKAADEILLKYMRDIRFWIMIMSFHEISPLFV